MMNMVTEKMDSILIMTKNRIHNFLVDEKGDTNFISILVLLGIALALAGIFLAFQEKIMNWVDTTIGGFFSDGVTDSTKAPSR